MDVIAEASLTCLYPDGACVPVRVGVGSPFPHPKGDWACEVFADGLRVWEGSNAICGVDSWQALILALRVLREMLQEEERQGAILHWPNGESLISVEELFAQHVIG